MAATEGTALAGALAGTAGVTPAPGATLPAIAVRAVSKRYGGRAVVDSLSFEVALGETFALLGPNGAGKTTTVELLEGYRAPDSGAIRVLGLDPRRDSQVIKARIGVMLQQGGVYPQIRPLEALRLFASFFADPLDPEALLDRAGLRDVARTRYRQLSGGERQRLSLALALVGRPELVFLDEPTAAMDPQARHATWQLIHDLKRQGVTVVLTTHYMEEAERLADRIAIIHRGRLVALGTPERLARERAAHEIRFSAPPGLDTTSLAAALGVPSVREVSRGRYVLPAEATPALIAGLATWLATQHALLTDLHVARQTLEEVFLSLTGDSGPADA